MACTTDARHEVHHRRDLAGSLRASGVPGEDLRSACARVSEVHRLPRLTGREFEVALDIDAAEQKDLAALEEGNWQLADPGNVAADPTAYRQFIQGSKAEFMVAKNMYVESASGWVSDRSICYLASGKPVLAQDTGIGHRYPVGAGLLTYTTLEEAAAGVEEIWGNYDHHARAARDLAEAYFDSKLVLGRLLDQLGVGR